MTINNQNGNQITRDNVLSLDIATHTGYFSTHGGGTWDFTESKKRNDNKQHGAFRKQLVDYIEKYDIKQIVAEDVSCGREPYQFIAMRKLSELRGILLEVCDTLDISRPAFINPLSVKKWATGDGHADKKKMIEFCKKRWQIIPVDDNEADAAHIFFYYCRIYKL